MLTREYKHYIYIGIAQFNDKIEYMSSVDRKDIDVFLKHCLTINKRIVAYDIETNQVINLVVDR